MKTLCQQNVIFLIKQLREREGYSQKRLSDELGVSAGQIGSIESLKSSHKYTLAQIWQICRLFNVRIEDIFLSKAEQAESENMIDSLIVKIVEYEQ